MTIEIVQDAIIKRTLLYRKGLRVKRLHTWHTLLPYSNGHHSANAALIAMELCRANNIMSSKCIRHMLLHDIAEQLTGDIPAPAKWENPEFATMVQQMETKWLAANTVIEPVLTEQEYDICKAADIIELAMHCIEERDVGNTTVSEIIRRMIKLLDAMTAILGVQSYRALLLDSEKALYGTG